MNIRIIVQNNLKLILIYINLSSFLNIKALIFRRIVDYLQSDIAVSFETKTVGFKRNTT